MIMVDARPRHDVVVVGARAAGAATAMLLSRLGHDVVLVDRVAFPSDTVSTHQLARTGVVQLHRWGLLQAVLDSGAPPLREVTFTADGTSFTHRVKDRAGVDLLVAPRRHILDTLLVDAAAAAGAQVRTGVAVRGIRRDGAGRVAGVHGHDAVGSRVEVAARFVVGADGLASSVARAVGAEIVEHRGDGGALLYAYFAGLPWRGIELVVGDSGLAGVFPTHDGQACVWVGTPSAIARASRRQAASRSAAFTGELARVAPELAARLRSGRRVSPVAGTLRNPNQLRRGHGPGWALAGDAGYHRDPVTGHGLSDAYRDAELLALALDRALRGVSDEHSALSGYQAERDRESRPVFELTSALSEYPPTPEFVALQKRLGRAIDEQAVRWAARPAPTTDLLAA
jgi:2-polyprenyl-6-methoxyphenol hydroxylase-like FAD-dependent oxidoreductase